MKEIKDDVIEKIPRDNLQWLMWFAAVIAGMIVFVYSTFATQKYVDDKIGSMHDDIKEIRSMVYDIHQDRGK